MLYLLSYLNCNEYHIPEFDGTEFQSSFIIELVAMKYYEGYMKTRNI